MRHFIGLILGLVLAAALFFGAGWGAEHVSALVGHSIGLPSRTGLIGLAAMLGVGLLIGVLLVVPAVSPLATGLPGLVLLGWTAGLAVSAHRALAWIPLPSHVFGLGFRASYIGTKSQRSTASGAAPGDGRSRHIACSFAIGPAASGVSSRICHTSGRYFGLTLLCAATSASVACGFPSSFLYLKRHAAWK